MDVEVKVGDTLRIRPATRAVVFEQTSDTVGVYYDGKYDAYKLLGGGLDMHDVNSQSPLEACLRREVWHESGRHVRNAAFLGVVDEDVAVYNEDIITGLFHQRNVCYAARVGPRVNGLGKEDQKRQSQTLFIPPAEALRLIKEQDVRGDPVGRANQLRDLSLLTRYMQSRDLHVNGAVSRPVEFYQHDRLPSAEVNVSAAYR